MANDNVIVKLFDTLKDSSDRNEASTQQLIKQQMDLVNQIKNLPMSDLRRALRDHIKDSATHYNDSEKLIEGKNQTILDELKRISTRIKIMIAVVMSAFTIMSVTYIVIRATANDNSKIQQLETQLEQYQEEQNKIFNKLKEQDIYLGE